MSNYYYNPMTTDLVFFDPETGQLLMLEKIDISGTSDKKPTLPAPPKKKGSKKPKLSLETINKIKEMRNRKISLKEIASELHISPSTVFKYASPKKKAVPEDGYVDPHKIESEEGT